VKLKYVTERYVKCPSCNSAMRLRESKHGPFYGCSKFPDCKETHGAHADGRPLGSPGNKLTREFRKSAHDMFDLLWVNGDMSRRRAYKLLALEMGVDEIHIGESDVATCKEIISKSADLFIEHCE